MLILATLSGVTEQSPESSMNDKPTLRIRGICKLELTDSSSVLHLLLQRGKNQILPQPGTDNE